MSVHLLVLALAAVVRPTSTAAVVVMLSTDRPQRLLTCYVAVGFAFSLGVGAMVLVLVQDLASAEVRTARPLVDVALGLTSLAYASATWAGRLPRPAPVRSRSSTWLQQRMRDLSPSGAAALGVLLHLPGLVYLAALNAIAGSATGTVDVAVQLFFYNAFRFGVPLVALALSASHPAIVRDRLEAATSWVRSHRKVLVVSFSTALGGYLLATGVADLAG